MSAILQNMEHEGLHHTSTSNSNGVSQGRASKTALLAGLAKVCTSVNNLILSLFIGLLSLSTNVCVKEALLIANMKPHRSQSGVVYGGTALLSGVNAITPHLAGAVDIMVVEQPDGTYKSSPFYGARMLIVL